MGKVRIEKLRVLAAVGVLFIGGSVVFAPSAAADVTLVDAVASLGVRAQNDVKQTGEVSFTDAFNEDLVANDPRVAAARGKQDTVLGISEGGLLATIDTSSFIEASAQDRPGNEATANSLLRVLFEIDAPATMQIQGVIAADHSDDTNCSLVNVSASDFSWQAGTRKDCGGDVSEVVIDEAIPLDAAGTYPIFIQALTAAEPREGADSSDGSASWNLSIGLCPNDFTDGNDVITGTSGDDVLCGGGGRDIITGGGGSDVLLGGAGADSLLGSDGDDIIEGADGDDIRLYGGPGDDTIDGGRGDDGRRQDVSEFVVGGAGNDIVFGGPGDELIVGDCGPKDLEAFICTPDPVPSPGDENEDIILGGPGKDVIFADGGGDTVGGGGGTDQIFGADGDDFIDGGPGDEVAFDTQFQGTAGIDGGNGRDTLDGAEGDDLIAGGEDRDRIRGQEGSDKLRGQEGSDCLIGGERKDVLVGGDGGDRLLARDGVRDELRGGSQFDRARIDDVDDVTGVENRNFQGGCP